MNPEKIGKFIYALRTERKLSQYQLADMIPISRQAISKWERGQTIPDSSTLIRLSDIFHVTINELLNGERLDSNSIKELEETTLSIVDESNRKTRKIRKIIVSFIVSTILLLLIFLSYYFINSYNTIKVYTINSDSSNFVIHEGIFITTKQKTYMKLGKIIPKEDAIINKIKVYYTKNNQKKLIFENEELDITIIDNYGYQEYFPENDLKNIIQNTYIEITYNETEKEIINIKFNRDFVNDFFFFIKKPYHIKEQTNFINHNMHEQEIVKFIKEKGVKQDNSYVFETIDGKDRISFSYSSESNQLIKAKNDIANWTIIIGNKEQYICFEQLDNESISNEECNNIVKSDLNKYLSQKG